MTIQQLQSVHLSAQVEQSDICDILLIKVEHVQRCSENSSLLSIFWIFAKIKKHSTWDVICGSSNQPKVDNKFDVKTSYI